jgi:hypothetical protein
MPQRPRVLVERLVDRGYNRLGCGEAPSELEEEA